MRSLTPPLAFSARPLDPVDLPRARELAERCGLHGVYVRNALELAGAAGGGDGESLTFHGAEGLLALAWFGDRGNLIVLGGDELDPMAMAREIRRSRWPWRIVLGAPPVVSGLRALCSGAPLVHREQIYYGMAPDAAPPALVRSDVRRPVRSDQERLMIAGLELNAVDLHVDPRRVDRGWLKRTVKQRIAEGTTRVLGAVGDLQCKLDFGSEGPAGLVVEGVFTFPEARGRGLATALVASVAAEFRGRVPRVCLHVAAGNAPARAAYERAGMRPAERCQLMLLG